MIWGFPIEKPFQQANLNARFVIDFRFCAQQSAYSAEQIYIGSKE